MALRVLALSGSLRAASINSALLRAVAMLAPAEIEVHVYERLGELPLFNPDLLDAPPAAVKALYTAVATTDALLIASPEYAHGVTGTLKNMLDWLVSFEPFVYKPVAVLNASPRAHHADDALRETLKTMSAIIVQPASVSIPLLGAKLDTQGMIDAPAVAQAIRGVLGDLQRAVVELQRQPPSATEA
jgi:chromate reductase, NAD(P)H dehydrogenase (quinone)